MRSEGESGAPEVAAPAELVRCLWRRRRTVLAVTGLALLVAAGLFATCTPSFRARATLLLEADRPGGLFGDLAVVAALSSAPAASSEISVLRSQTLAEEVVTNLGLTTRVSDEGLSAVGLVRATFAAPSGTDRPPTWTGRRLFASAASDPEDASEAPRAVRVEFLAPDRVRLTTPGLLANLGLGSGKARELTFAPGEALRYEGLELRLEVEGDPVGAPFVVERLPAFRAVEDLLERLAVGEVERNSGVISVAVVDRDPHRAAETVNALCESYLISLAERTQARASGTVAYLRELIEEERARFEEAQAELLAAQRADPAAIDLDATAESLIEDLSAVAAHRSGLEVRRRTLAGVVAALEAGEPTALARLDAAVSGGLVVDPMTEALLGEMAELVTVLGRQSATARPDYPPLVEAAAALEELERGVATRLASRLEGLASEDEILGEEETRLRAALGRLPEATGRLARPLLVVRTHEVLLPSLVESLRAAEITQRAAHLSARFVDRARPPVRALAPRPALWLVGGLALGLLVGCLLAVVTEPRGGRTTGRAAFEDATGIEVLAVVPRAPALAPRDQPDGRAAEALRLASLALAHRGTTAPRVIATTAPGPGEGSTSTAVGLAIVLAAGGRRVLLIDADRRARAQALLAPGSPGPAVGAEDSAGWRVHVRRSSVSGLDLLDAGAPVGDDGLADALRAEYEAVVLALPPALAGPDAIALGRMADAVLLVAEAGRTASAALAHAARTLSRAGVPLTGGVLRA